MFEKRVVMSLSFRLRTTRTEGMAGLYCRLYYETSRYDDYSCGIRVPIEAWESRKQRVDPTHPQAADLMRRISLVRAQHDRILLRLQTQEDRTEPIEIQEIAQAWLKRDEVKVELTLQVAMMAKIKQIKGLTGDEKRAKDTIRYWEGASRHLEAYLQKEKQLSLLAKKVNHTWGRLFYDHLCSLMSRSAAVKYVTMVKSALQYAEDYGKVTQNGLKGLRLKKDPPKPIYFLTLEKVDELAKMPIEGVSTDRLKESIKSARNWALLMCYTGLDYHDALVVAKNPEKYIRQTEHGQTIVYQRIKLQRKPTWGECHIPVLEKTQELLADAPNWKRPKIRNMNDFLNEFGRKLGLPFSFCTKVCRKTSGIIFLHEGFGMTSIQKILGHNSLLMTERHYLNVQPSVVHRDMARRLEKTVQPTKGSPFLHIYKAS